jgi:DNA modification methylase
MKAITANTLFYGDNLLILRDHIPDESIDLVYLDPPFNSNRSYNVLFKEEGGKCGFRSYRTPIPELSAHSFRANPHSQERRNAG